MITVLILLYAAGTALIFSHLKTITMAQQQIAEEIRAYAAQVKKGKDEVIGRIASLEEQLGNSNSISPEVRSALDELKGAAQDLDNIVPDAPVETDQPEDAPAADEFLRAVQDGVSEPEGE